jgi:hypothetical protein
MNLVTDLKSIPIFPIPIGFINFGESHHDLNMQLVEDSLKDMNDDPIGEDHSNMGGWHSKPGLEKKYSSYENLCNILTECGNNYCKMHGYKTGLKCLDIWSNINKSGDLNFFHHHGTTSLAGVYYPIKEIIGDDWIFDYSQDNPIKAGTWDNKNGGSLVFQDPAYGKKVNLLKDKSTPFNIDFYHLYPSSSVLVLFPSYLLHMVLPFYEDKVRLSISFAFTYGKN